MPPAGGAARATVRGVRATSLGAPRRRTDTGPTAAYPVEEPVPGAPAGTATPTERWGSRARTRAKSPTFATCGRTLKFVPEKWSACPVTFALKILPATNLR